MTRPTLYVVAIVTVALDQLAKVAVLRVVPADQPGLVWGPYLSITVQHNPGAAFGLFQSATVYLSILAVVIIVLIVGYGTRLAGSNTLVTIGLALVLGGAGGNLIDRLRLGYVVDFIDLHFWPVFNVADIAITCGGALIIIGLLRLQRHGQSG